MYPPQNNTSYDNLYKLCYKLYFTQVFISHNNFIFLNLELPGFPPIIFVFWNIFKVSLLFIFKVSLLFIFFWPIMFMSTSHDISMCKILIQSRDIIIKILVDYFIFFDSIRDITYWDLFIFSRYLYLFWGFSISYVLTLFWNACLPNMIIILINSYLYKVFTFGIDWFYHASGMPHL